MIEYTEKIREIAQRLFTDGTVEMVIGFRQGTVPMMNEPCFATSPADANALCWDSNCGINLANYLTDRKEKIGIVAKGCDSRNIVTHIIENKIKREQLYIIGVPCQGMIDRRKINAMADAVEERLTLEQRSSRLHARLSNSVEPNSKVSRSYRGRGIWTTYGLDSPMRRTTVPQ